MGLPVAKEELAKVAAEPSSSIQTTTASSGSKVRPPFSLISLCKKLGAVTGLLVVSAFLDIAFSGTSDVWISAVVAYATAIVAMVAISRVVVAQKFQSDLFPALVIVAATFAAVGSWAFGVFTDLSVESAAAHAVSFASFFCALYLWLALRGFLAARVWELQDYEKALFPAVAWKVDKIGVPEYRTDPQTLKPGDLCLARKGDLLPCDGVVERGVAVLWERTLSGRSSLRIRGIGEEVYAASSVVTGEIVFRSSAEQKDSRITSFAEFLYKAGKGSRVLLKTVKGPALLSLIFVAACVALGWNEAKLPWERTLLACSATLSTVALIEFATIVFSLPGIFIYRGFLKGILFNSVSAMSRVAELKNLIVDYSPSEPPVGARLKDFTILDGRIDRGRIESALLAILGRVSEEYANAIENVITTPAAQIYPCRLSDFNEYPGLGMSATIEGAEFSVGGEEFLVARGVRLQPSELLTSVAGEIPMYVAIGDEVVARFIFATADLSVLSGALDRFGIRLRLFGATEAKALDVIGKQAGLELALINGGLTTEQYCEKLKSLPAAGVLANSATAPQILKDATCSVSNFDPMQWNIDRSPITVFGHSAEVVADLFKISRLFRLKRFTVAAFGGGLALLLLTLSCLAWLTPAVVLVAAASGITFALLLIEEFKR